MTSARPQTIANELFDKIQTWAFSQVAPSEFELKRTGLEAERLLRADVVDGSIARSGLAALQWDTEAVDYWVNNALRNRRSAATLHNAAVSYKIVNNIDLAAKYSIESVRLAPQDSSVVFSACNVLVRQGSFEMALDILSNLKEKNLETAKLFENLESLSVGFRNSGLTEDQIILEKRCAYEIATANKVRLSGVEHVFGTYPDGGSYIVASLPFSGTFEDELLLEEQLAEKLSIFESWNPNRLSVEFKHRLHHELHTA